MSYCDSEALSFLKIYTVFHSKAIAGGSCSETKISKKLYPGLPDMNFEIA